MLVALQAPTNAMLARSVNSPVNAAFISFAVGTVALLAIVLALGVRPSGAELRALPWYAWIGGLYGAFFVTAAAFAAPRLGVTYLLTLGIGGQLVMAVLLDRYGAFGVPAQEITPARVFGLALVLGGVILVRK